MNRKDAHKIRTKRAMEIIAKHADDDDWERIVEILERIALALIKAKKVVLGPDPVRPWWMP